MISYNVKGKFTDAYEVNRYVWTSPLLNNKNRRTGEILYVN